MDYAEIAAQAEPVLREYGDMTLNRAEQAAVNGTARIGWHLMAFMKYRLDRRREASKQQAADAGAAEGHADMAARGGASGKGAMIVNGRVGIANTGHVGSLRVRVGPSNG